MTTTTTTFRFDAELWAHDDGAWHFVTLPVDVSDEIRAATDGPRRPGFGSVRVRATIGDSTWSTSVFPDKARGAYVLPVKKPVRRAEGIVPGDTVAVAVELVGD